MSRDVIIVAGMASKGANLSPLRMLGDRYQEESVHYIDGARIDNNQLVVSSPMEQVAEIDHILKQSNNTGAVIYSQSIGALAAVVCLENMSDRHFQAIAIAPPLPDPVAVLNHPRIRKRMQMTNGQLSIPSFSFALENNGPSNIAPQPVEVLVSDTYFEEVAAASNDFLRRVKRLLCSGNLQLVLPSQDWNSGSQDVVTGLYGVHTVKGTHSLHSTHDAMDATASELFKLALSPTVVF